MQKRKKKVLDGLDKKILRTLYIKRPLVSRKIAKIVGLSSSAIAPRLNYLQEIGILKQAKLGGIRSFKRDFGNTVKQIESPRSIFWDLNLK